MEGCGPFFGGEENNKLLQNVSLHFGGLFQNGEEASADIMMKGNARTLVVWEMEESVFWSS